MTEKTEQRAPEAKTVTVSEEFTYDPEGLIVTVLPDEVKRSLTAKLSAKHEGLTLSETRHEVVREDAGREVTVKVSATGTPKK